MHPAPEQLDDLRQHRFIGFDRDISLIGAAEALGMKLSASDFAFRSDSILAHIEAIRSGIGIGVTHVGLAEAWPDVIPVLDQVRPT